VHGDHEEGYGWFRLAEARKMLGKHKDTLNILEKAHAYLLRHKNGGSNHNHQQKTP
jgi:hypothetical protein